MSKNRSPAAHDRKVPSANPSVNASQENFFCLFKHLAMAERSRRPAINRPPTRPFVPTLPSAAWSSSISVQVLGGRKAEGPCRFRRGPRLPAYLGIQLGLSPGTLLAATRDTHASRHIGGGICVRDGGDGTCHRRSILHGRSALRGSCTCRLMRSTGIRFSRDSLD